MSVSRNTYLGPYFRCKTRTEEVNDPILACPNAACRLVGERVEKPGSSFCRACGDRLDPSHPRFREVELPDRWEVSEAIDEALSEVTGDDADFPEDFDYHVWVPNVSRPGKPKRASADDSCGVEILLDDVDIGAEKEWLANAYHEEWATLLKMYGGPGGVSVETRWGLLRWCS